ncbi:MAG: class I SAM-dependent rRNA methyltransferase [Myxococcota bacterium]
MSSDPLATTQSVTISSKGARQLRAGHLWVYRSDLRATYDLTVGVAEVRDERGAYLGRALCSPRSNITLRLLTRDETIVDSTFIRERLRVALAWRERVMPGADAYRWVHGEADLLPGVFVDRYGDCVSLQTTCAATDALEPLLVAFINELVSPRIIVIRDDVGSRRREGLRAHVTLAQGSPPTVARYHEGDVQLEVDLLADQKTGGFLDQALNHQRAAHYAQGDALDCFTYHGGFALQMARVCTSVLAVDQSAPALVRTVDNAQRAGFANVETLRANVFDLLPEMVRAGKTFDTVVLDPPALASQRATVPRALAGYKELNLRAMRLVRPGGVLITCSCSGRVTSEDFDAMLADAAQDARRAVQILERRTAGPDHPVLVGVPETDYLKCRILVVL